MNEKKFKYHIHAFIKARIPDSTQIDEFIFVEYKDDNKKVFSKNGHGVVLKKSSEISVYDTIRMDREVNLANVNYIIRFNDIDKLKTLLYSFVLNEIHIFLSDYFYITKEVIENSWTLNISNLPVTTLETDTDIKDLSKKKALDKLNETFCALNEACNEKIIINLDRYIYTGIYGMRFENKIIDLISILENLLLSNEIGELKYRFGLILSYFCTHMLKIKVTRREALLLYDLRSNYTHTRSVSYKFKRKFESWNENDLVRKLNKICIGSLNYFVSNKTKEDIEMLIDEKLNIS